MQFKGKIQLIFPIYYSSVHKDIKFYLTIVAKPNYLKQVMQAALKNLNSLTY